MIFEKEGDGVLEKGENKPARLERLVGLIMDLMEQTLEEMGEGEVRGADTKALREIISALKELKGLLPQEEPRQEGLRVIFEAGEEAFNE